VAPLNAPPDDVGADLEGAIRSASGVAFTRAMWLSAGILVIGAAVSAFGLRKEAEVSGTEGVRLGGQVCVPLQETA
jgi:hypothetical protein